MHATKKTKAQLIHENTKLRRKLTRLEKFKKDIDSINGQLHQQRKENEVVFDSVPTAIWYFDRDGRLVRANHAAISSYGDSRQEIIGKKADELLPSDTADRFMADLKEVLETGKPKLGIIEEYPLPSGRKRIVHSDLIPYLGDNTSSIALMVFERDITEQKLTEEALHESEEIFTLFLEHNPIYVFFKDENIRSIRLSRNYEKMLNMPIDQIIGKTMNEIFPSDLAKSMIEDDLRILRENKLNEVEEELDGKYYKTIKFPIIRNGKPALLAGFTIDITKQKQTEKALKESVARLRRLVGYNINIIGRAVELKCPYTSGHQKGVSNLARAIATEMGLSPDEIECIRMAGSVHDVGKIAIPAEILSMPRRLTRVEFNLMKTHTQRGKEVLEGIEFPWPIADIVVQHHERLDGSGYPRHLKGNKILLSARIIGIADVVEAMASHRPYRPALGIEAALAEIEKGMGVSYDGDAVDACLRLFRERGFNL